ncbi:hypothetical protein LSH36_2443g00004, partial [Paralvinella palmiformis]
MLSFLRKIHILNLAFCINIGGTSSSSSNIALHLPTVIVFVVIDERSGSLWRCHYQTIGSIKFTLKTPLPKGRVEITVPNKGRCGPWRMSEIAVSAIPRTS